MLCVFGEFVENESMCADHLFEKGDQCPGQGWSEANREVFSCFCLARFSPQLEGMKEGNRKASKPSTSPTRCGLNLISLPFQSFKSKCNF